ncbi:MAG: formylmethanofuran dehydrogenase subunit C [Bdellovibrio sp.]|nr:formylmethanofuran dehydrogenase subunit C [Methylotenera sp.]
MISLIFTLKSTPALKLDCSRLTPNGLAGLTMPQVSNLALTNNKTSPKVVDIFDISGSVSENIVFKNSNTQLHFIGHKMKHGQITIEGDCGDFLGANMQGGTILCNGNAGDRVGDQMRRGLILIDGDAGDYLASRMIAGTIGVCGSVGKLTGFAMKRGTILLNHQPDLHASFHATMQDCGTHNLPFLAILFKSFQALPSKFSTLENQRVQRFAGDLACNGNGEILVLQP